MTDSASKLLDELELLAKAATPGPWRVESTDEEVFVSTGYGDGECDVARFDVDVADPETDSAFIAALHPARALELIEVVRAALGQRLLCEDTLPRLCAALDKLGGPNG